MTPSERRDPDRPTTAALSGAMARGPIDVDSILLAHGSGGTMTSELVEGILLPELPPAEEVEALLDGATFQVPEGRVAMTSDSFVVRPLFFPGGDIGTMAVFGTVNDLAMCGAVPWYLSLGLVLEEGLPIDTFRRVARSIGAAARQANVRIITGDTKVVERGKGDGMYVHTTGIGLVPEGVRLSPRVIREGDEVILSGPIGEHGMAVMSHREGLELETEIRSDVAPVHEAVFAVLEHHSQEVRCLRDPTRGGVATSLVEIANYAGKGIRVWEGQLVIPDAVAAACDLLGVDPLHVASEGRFLLICDPQAVDGVLDTLRAHRVSEHAHVIGRVEPTPGNLVVLETVLGGERTLERLSGEQLPRIC